MWPPQETQRVEVVVKFPPVIVEAARVVKFSLYAFWSLLTLALVGGVAMLALSLVFRR